MEKRRAVVISNRGWLLGRPGLFPLVADRLHGAGFSQAELGKQIAGVLRAGPEHLQLPLTLKGVKSSQLQKSWEPRGSAAVWGTEQSTAACGRLTDPSFVGDF